MLNDYYKLKNNYENEILKEKKKIIKNQELSWKEKRNEFKSFKPKCINCKRPVGTIFSIKYNTEVEFRELKAICGSRTDPCNLNININPPALITSLILFDFKKSKSTYNLCSLMI